MKRVPGFIWLAVLALIPLLIQWLNGEYFAGQAWVSFVIVTLGFIGNLIKAYQLMEDERTLISNGVARSSDSGDGVGFPYKTFLLG